MSWTITVPLPLTSANKRLVNGRHIVARAMYRKARDEWAYTLRVLMLSEGIPKATAKRRITLTRIIGPRQREYDYGNLVGGAKHALDACKKAGLIVDDSPTWCIDVYQQRPRVDSKEFGTIITVEDIAEEESR